MLKSLLEAGTAGREGKGTRPVQGSGVQSWSTVKVLSIIEGLVFHFISERHL